MQYEVKLRNLLQCKTIQKRHVYTKSSTPILSTTVKRGDIGDDASFKSAKIVSKKVGLRNATVSVIWTEQS